MAKYARALNEDGQDQEVDAVLEKRIADKYQSLAAIHRQTLEEIFASLPEEMHLKFKAAIETNADKDIEDIIIDFIIEEKIPFKRAEDVVPAQAPEDGAAAGAAAASNQVSDAIRGYVEDSLRNYANIKESRNTLGSKEGAILPEFKDKKAALEALKAAQIELEVSKKIFAKTLADEEKINKLLKKKASAGEAQELSRIYSEGIISQMQEARRDLKSKAELVLEIIGSEHIQNDITPEALAAENKASMSWIRGTMDSPAALKKAMTSDKADADKALADCSSFLERFKEVKAAVEETAETTKYSKILPILINQIPLEQHKSIGGGKDITIKSAVFRAIKYLAKNGAIEAVDPMAQHKGPEARINNSADRISKKLAEFTPEARERILVKTAEAMVIGQNLYALAQVAVNPDRKRGFNHFMEEFNKACDAETKAKLEKPEELDEGAKEAIKEMCKKLDVEFNMTFENASKPRPSAKDIISFTAKRVALNLVNNPVLQSLALGAAGVALEAATPALTGAIGASGARAVIGAGQKVVEGGQRIIELKTKGHTPKIAGLIAAAEAGVDVFIPTMGLDPQLQATLKKDFLSAINQFAEELRKPETLKLIEAAAQDKKREVVSENALVQRAGAEPAVSSQDNHDAKAPGEAAKEILVKRMMEVTLNPVIEKLPSALQANKDLRQQIDGFVKPYVENLIEVVIVDAKARLGKALSPSERAMVAKAAEPEPTMPKIAGVAADHVSDAAAALIRNQAGSNPAPATQAAALAGIVAAGNIAGEMGVNPGLLNAAAAIAAQAAGIQVGRDPEPDLPSAAAGRRPSSLQIKEESDVAVQAQAIVAGGEVRAALNPQQASSAVLPSQRHGAARSRSSSW